MLRLRPDLLIIFFGANDAVVEQVAQYCPIEEFVSNLGKMVQLAKAEIPATRLILVTPPPIAEDKLKDYNLNKGKPITVDRTNERTHQYVLAVEHVGKTHQVPVVDLWQALKGDSVDRGLYLIDGLHLNELGNKILYEEVVNTIANHFVDLKAEFLEMDHPHWSNVAHIQR